MLTFVELMQAVHKDSSDEEWMDQRHQHPTDLPGDSVEENGKNRENIRGAGGRNMRWKVNRGGAGSGGRGRKSLLLMF